MAGTASGNAAKPPPPVLCILAAGASRRLGTCKALVPLAAEPPATPLELLLAAGRGLGDPPAVVVTGADHEAITDALAAIADPPATVHNPEWRRGRTGGVLRAAERFPGRALCIAPVDVPLVPLEVFRALAVAWAEAGSPARGWLAPWVRADGPEAASPRRFGHPVVLGPELLLEELPRDRPLRSLRDRASPLLGVEVGTKAILDDLDTPEDLERLRSDLARGPSAADRA